MPRIEALGIRLTPRHWRSFAALADHGRPDRAAAWLRLSVGTMLDHVRDIERRSAAPLFHRLPGGVLLTEAGYRERQRIGEQLARAGLALRHLRYWNGEAPNLLLAWLPRALPGAAVDRALARLCASLAIDQPHLGLASAVAEGAAALVIRHGAEGSLRDRWAVLRPRDACSTKRARLLIPLLPIGLRRLAAQQARAMGREGFTVDLSPASLLAGVSALPEPEILLPASFLDPMALPACFDLRVEAEGPFDPYLRVEGRAYPVLAARLSAELGAALGSEPPPLPPPGETFSAKQARSLLVLEQERHVGRAAARLFVVQPALTIQLRQIERLAGRSLFDRTPRGLRPRPGVEAVRDLLAPVVEAMEVPSGAVPRPTRIGLITQLDEETIVSAGLAVALCDFRAEQGDRGFEVVEGLTAELIRQLRDGCLDLVVVNQHLVQPDLEQELLVEDHLVAVVDARRRLLPDGPVRLAALLRLPLVLPSGRHALRALVEGHAAAAGSDTGIAMEVESASLAIRLVTLGPFATILPIGTVAAGAVRRRLTLHPIVEPSMARRICAVRRAGDRAGSAFMEHLRRAFAVHGCPGGSWGGILYGRSPNLIGRHEPRAADFGVCPARRTREP